MTFRRSVFLIGLITLLTAACQQGESATPIVQQTADTVDNTPTPQTPTPTFTPSLTPSPSSSPTPTPTPTNTPTPTPTAPPIVITNTLRESQIGPPVPIGNAPCGVVDILDFPLDPPDGATASGGGDFGVFRSRYDKFHAGEDWWGVRGRNSFGEPVYSIGHGLVTYAEPEGWNRDKGVIIIRHVFADGSDVLSFYGHLDPPSVLLEPGDCVERGEQIGQIGRPRSSPHLHFEIRTQAPYQTLTGYWPEDPTLVGWLPPSAYIWTQRLNDAPGVQWIMPDSLPYAFEAVDYVGLYGETLITVQSQELTGINIQNGRQLWQLENEDTKRVYSALVDNRFPIVYTADRSGRIGAYSLLGNQTDAASSLQPLWDIELDIFGRTDFLLMPEGGLLVAANDRFFALNGDGSILWETEAVGQLSNWTIVDDHLLVSVSGEGSFLGTADASGIDIWENSQEEGWPENGTVAVAGEHLWLYSRDGLYRLDWEMRTAELVYPFARGLTSLGDIIGLPDGSVLLAHADTADRRLLAFDPDGSLRWERSYEEFISGAVQLIEQDGRVYLMDTDTNGSNSVLTLYAINLSNADLAQIFVGGSRSRATGNTWVITAEDYFIINIAGGNLLAFEPYQNPQQ